MSKLQYPKVCESDGFIHYLKTAAGLAKVNSINAQTNIVDISPPSVKYMMEAYINSLGITKSVHSVNVHKLTIGVPPHDDSLYLKEAKCDKYVLLVPLALYNSDEGEGDIPRESYLYHSSKFSYIENRPILFNASKTHALIAAHAIECAVIFFKR